MFFNYELWRKVLIIGLIMILFPNVANDYKMTVLIPGAIALLATAKAGDRNAMTCLFILCLIFVPKSYVFITGVGLSNILHPILLIALAVFALIPKTRLPLPARILPN